MIIAAHIFAATLRESFLYNCLLLLAKEQPRTRFILFVEEKLNMPDNLPGNVEMTMISPAIKNGLLLHYWYSFKLPVLIKKKGVTHFISESNVLSLRSSIPQFLLISDLSFLLRKPVVVHEYARYTKRYFAKFVSRAAGILVTENFLGDSLQEKYPLAKENTCYAGHGLVKVFKPINTAQREQFLQTFSDGTEYFIAECSVVTQVNIFSLVKAFSLFKKRQKSSMQLVLLFKGIKIEDCIKDFHLYKYRNDVKIIAYSNDEDYAALLAASYGAIYLPVQVLAENTGLHALASGTPLVTFENVSALSVYGDAALYADLSEKSIAENMMLLYKDEILRKELVEKGLKISNRYTWQAAATNVWQAV